jgi:D-aminopeptidase
VTAAQRSGAEGRVRVRELGVAPGVMQPGPMNAITDVVGVRVGHVTLWRDEGVRTGVTVVMPHSGDPFDERVPAGLFVANGYGKLIGATQVCELGEIETPVVLTNTLSVPEAAAGLVDWVLTRPGHGDVRSLNPFVGETNDGVLNDIRSRAVRPEHVSQAIEAATAGPVAEGCVGAGTGTVAFGWKAGIGTSSRVLPPALGGATVGVLVQANHGGVLGVDGIRVGERLGRHDLQRELDRGDADGSVMVVVATDAPLSDRNLRRLAVRAAAGLARTGASYAHGSGDYALAFSTAREVRRADRGRAPEAGAAWPNERLSPLSQAVLEATEEAVLNALTQAVTVRGWRGRVVEALPLDALRALLAERPASTDAP